MGHEGHQVLTHRKLETIGRHAGLIPQRARTLPPSVSALYVVRGASLRLEFERAVMMDLRSKSCTEIKALFTPLSPPKRTRKLMIILVLLDLNERARYILMADIDAAVARIIESPI